MQFVISLLIFGVITVGTVVEENNTEQEIKKALPVKESILLTLERTPCFGRCATYKYSIFTTGKVVYYGEANVTNLGHYKAQLTQKQIAEIKAQIEIANIFSMKNKYDAKITDIPSTLLIVNINGKKKKIYDRHGAPDALKDFEKFVDGLVLKSKMTKVKKPKEENGY